MGRLPIETNIIWNLFDLKIIYLLLGMNMVLVVLVIIITAQIRLKLLKACFVMTSRMFAVDRNKHFIDKIMLMLCCSLLIFRSPPDTLDTPLKAHRSLALNIMISINDKIRTRWTFNIHKDDYCERY